MSIEEPIKISFSDYQKSALKSDQTGSDPNKSLMVTLLGLAGESGSLLTEYKKWLRDGESYSPFTHHVAEEIGDMLWYLANLASKLNLDLGEIAQENLAKVEERWPTVGKDVGSLFPVRFDAEFPANERLPDELEIELIEEVVDARDKVSLIFKGERIGNELTDNSHVEDGYRYHDVFHIGCAVLLGWSPVLRRILKCKRKAVPRIDEVEDGARAFVTEEGISALIFGYARDHSMFSSSTSVDYDILRSIRVMVRPFEVRSRSLHDWQNAILKSYAVWRKVIQHEGGIVIGNSLTGELEFKAPSRARTT